MIDQTTAELEEFLEPFLNRRDKGDIRKGRSFPGYDDLHGEYSWQIAYRTVVDSSSIIDLRYSEITGVWEILRENDYEAMDSREIAVEAFKETVIKIVNKNI